MPSGPVDLTLSDSEDDDDFASSGTGTGTSAAAAAAAAAAPTVVLRPPAASARPGRPPALVGMDRAAVDRRLLEVRKQLAALRREEARLVARQQELELSDEARAEEQLRAANRVRKWDAPFEWDRRVDRVLRERFQLQAFRPGQRGVVNAALSGQDVLVLMATGSGKSLCFQLPGMADEPPGLTLVISPLKSLMQDQCYELQQVGIAADFITADTESSETTRVLNEIAKPRAPDARQFLYVTPERVAKSKKLLAKLEIAYRARRIRRFVVDEVHCVSIDGNDFRPDYLKLAILRTQFRDVPIIGCTATATVKVLKEVASTLCMRGACEFVGDFDRPNLFLRVMRKDPAEKAHIATMAQLIRDQHAGETGIIYCHSKKECENFALQLQSEGICAQPYHASMADTDRAFVHKSWRDGSVHVVCATIAFGMGINASGCRFVIHSTMSKGLDSYWQEAGRAGRDGSLAACTVFARGADLTRQSSMVADVPKKVNRIEQLKRLYAAYRFALQPATECRRASLLRWFGQDPRAAIARCKKAGRCDVCDPMVAEDAAAEGCAVDVAEGLGCLLQIAERLRRRGGGDKLTLIKLAEAWRSNGAAHKSVREGHDGEVSLPCAPYNKEDCERIVAVAICDELLEERFVASSYNYNSYVQLGKKGNDVLSGAAELPPTLVWLTKAAAGKSEKGGGGGAKKKKKRKVAATLDTAASSAVGTVGGSRATSNSTPAVGAAAAGGWNPSTKASSKNHPGGSAGAHSAAAGRTTTGGGKRGGKSKLALGGKGSAKGAGRKQQRQQADIRAFADYDRVQEQRAAAATTQSTWHPNLQQQEQQQEQQHQHQHQQQQQQRSCGYDLAGGDGVDADEEGGADDGDDDDDDDGIESCESDVEFKREVAKIDAVYAEKPHGGARAHAGGAASFPDSAPAADTGTGTGGASPPMDLDPDAASETVRRKKRRAPVPTDSADEDDFDDGDDFDFDKAAAADAEFEAELRQAGGLATPPEPPDDVDHAHGDEGSDDDRFDVGAESMFD